MIQQVVIVLDCGATNLKVAAVSLQGKIISTAFLPNKTFSDSFYTNGRIWDVQHIMNQLYDCCRKVVSKMEHVDVVGITVTSFGVDGSFFSADGEMLYPIISWQCNRTETVMNNIDEFIDKKDLHNITGLQSYHFNTINKIAWFLKNKPEIIDKADSFLFISAIILYILTGEKVTEITMAGTSMLTDIRKFSFSDDIAQALGISINIFPNLTESGSCVGNLLPEIAKKMGLKAGIPVIATGHDTQFAVYGAGATETSPVLSSGTWEILMARTQKLNKLSFNQDFTIEFDACKGFYNPGVMWTASGVLEWVIQLLYCDYISQSDKYDRIIAETWDTLPGSNGIKVNPDIFVNRGIFSGLSNKTERKHIYRAVLESLSQNTVNGLKLLEHIGNFKANSIICVGGGSKNKLWNQIRADMVGLPIKTITNSETTVLGAAIFVFYGIGMTSTPEEARNQMEFNFQETLPGPNYKIYQQLMPL